MSENDEKHNDIMELQPTTAQLIPLAREARRVLDAAHAKTTRRTYGSALRSFEAWMGEKSLVWEQISPEVVVLYLTSLGTRERSLSLMGRSYSAIAIRMREIDPAKWPRGHRPDVIQRFFLGARREYGRPLVQKKPILPEHFRQLADPARFDVNRWILSARNRALLLFGFAGGFRRSELVALDVADIELRPDAAVVLVKRSKTDPAWKGAYVGIYRQEERIMCPVAALEAYLKGAKITEGAVFRRVLKSGVTAKRLSDEYVADVVKQAIASLGLDPSEYAGHSLRCGFVTAAHARGARIEEIMHTTRHRSYQQVLGYLRRETVLEGNASRNLFGAKKEKTDV